MQIANKIKTVAITMLLVIPSDFVYTAKLFYALNDLVQKKYFTEETRILAIHSGGLQGNRSLPNGTLIF